MATRAIRYDQLTFDSNDTITEAVAWCNYQHSDTEIWGPLQVAVAHQIENAGDTAAEIQNRMATVRNEQYACANYYGVMNTVYAHLVPQMVAYELNAPNETLQTLMRKNMREMRNMVKAKTTPNGYFDYRNDSDFLDIRNEMIRAMNEFAKDFNHQFFASCNSQVLSQGVNVNCLEGDTTDDQIDEMIDITTGHWGSLWRINTYYFLNGGFNMKSMAHQYPSISDDVMEIFMENLIENHPSVALMIAKNDQFFQDNPMAQSIGHSWTSRNRSDDCWFKIPHDQVNKKRTISFAPPRTFFGKFTPTLSDMKDNLLQFKTDVKDFLKSAEPKVTLKVDAANALQEQTVEAMQNSIRTIVQDLLDDPDTVDIGTAILGHLAGIATLPIDTSDLTLFPTGYITYSYHDFTHKRDTTQYLYPSQIQGKVSLSDFNVTDEVQEVLYTAYRENLQQHRDNHAHRCAQLARQIAQQTTRHDAEIKVITEAFGAYQTQV